MKQISNNTRSNHSTSFFHLLSFEIKDFDGNLVDTIRITDNDIISKYNDEYWNPLNTTFDGMQNSSDMSNSAVSIDINNVPISLSKVGITQEWRNNKCYITRIYYNPNDTIDLMSEGFPCFNVDNIAIEDKDIEILFWGLIDNFAASETNISCNINSLFNRWQNPSPNRWFDQKEFTTIIDTVAQDGAVFWGKNRNY